MDKSSQDALYTSLQNNILQFENNLIEKIKGNKTIQTSIPDKN